MNYVLAKELKDNGFPQIPQHKYIISPNDVNEAATAPSLEELIEACGDDFINIERNKDGTFSSLGWYPRYEESTIGYTRATPSEAVALLWITLNKK